MRQADVKRHWEELAREHGTQLAATTKTPTIKRLELDALERALRAAGIETGAVLEAGCGNGWNCLELARRLPGAGFVGFDYVAEMIASARAAGAGAPVRFEVADLLALDDAPSVSGPWDAIFTDRCLINLLDHDLQLRAVEALVDRVRPGGTMIVLENTTEGRDRQNRLRRLAGLPDRPPPEHNLFLDEERFLAGVEAHLDLVSIDDFGSLHDLVLYVLVPLTNGGKVEYDHPLVEAATELSLAGGLDDLGLAPVGQNRLYRFVRR